MNWKTKIYKFLFIFTLISIFSITCYSKILYADDIVGEDLNCAEIITSLPDVNEAPSMLERASSTISIIPQDSTYVSNCIPFGNNTSYQFTGFIYRNVPPFNLAPGDKIAFDLGSLNDKDTRRDIYFSVANKNPGPPVVSGNNVVSQGIKATQWIKVVSDTQIPLNSQGNYQCGDYELIYKAETSFNFPGGGLVVGFASSPPAAFADGGCQQVLCCTRSNDSSGFFYSRFFDKGHLTLDTLDNISSGGSAVELGGIVIEASGSGGGECDLTPVLEALEVVESKLDGDLPGQLESLGRLINGLVDAVEALEAKSDALEGKLDNVGVELAEAKAARLVIAGEAKAERAALETKSDRLEVELADEREVAKTERAALESKSDALEAKLDEFLASGEVVEINDLAPGQGGVFFIGAEKQPKPDKPLKEQQGQ